MLRLANVCCSLNVRRQHILTLADRLPAVEYYAFNESVEGDTYCAQPKGFKSMHNPIFWRVWGVWSAVQPTVDFLVVRCAFERTVVVKVVLGLVSKTGYVWNPTKQQTRMLTMPYSIPTSPTHKSPPKFRIGKNGSWIERQWKSLFFVWLPCDDDGWHMN